MNHKWNYRPITPGQAETSQILAQELGISPILGQLLVQRGITKAADAKKFFRPQLPDLHDPFLMKDMDVAVERLNKAMGKKERILIYGDYDVDGTTAVALVYKFIQQFYSNLDYYICDSFYILLFSFSVLKGQKGTSFQQGVKVRKKAEV